MYCRGKGTEENIQKARETIDNCRVYYAHGRCSYDEVLNYDNIYNEKLDLDLRKYYNKFISIYNKTLEFDDDKYTYMFVQSKIPCILERSRLIYSTLYDELQNVYQDKTLDEKEIIKDIIGFYQSNLMFLSGVIEDFVADNWDVDIESDFCYKDFLKDIFEDTEYNNYINNVVEYIKSSYDYQQIELNKLVDEFNADCKNANVLKNTIKSKKTAEENLFSPITLGDVVMGAIAYGTMEDTKNEYNEYSSDVKIIELKNDFASDKMDDAVIYIKAMIKEIMASDIYIGESPVMVSNVTAPNNDMTKADNVTAESTDKVSDLRAGLNSNELPALLKQYFSTHAEPEKAMASSKLKAGLSLPSDCEVYYAQDATLLGSGKNGFAITSKGVYTRKMFEKNVIIKPLDVFKTGKQFSTDKSTPGLLLDGQFFVECLSGDKLVPLFNGLVEYLDKAKAENSAVSESDNSATKYCPNCGTALRGQAKFCSKCGYKL